MPLRLGIRHRGVFAEVADVTSYIFVVLAVVAVVVGLLLATQYIAFGTLQLALGKSVFLDSLNLGQYGLDASIEFAVFGVDAYCENLQSRAETKTSDTDVCRSEWRIRLHSNLAQTRIGHSAGDGVDKRKPFGHDGIVHLLRQSRVFDIDCRAAFEHLGVGKYGDNRLLVVGYHDDLLLHSIGRRSGNVGHQRSDFVLDCVHIHIADHDYGLILGTIPSVVEIAYCAVVERFEAVEITDKVAMLVFGAFTDGFDGFDHRTPRCAIAGTQLLHNHTALRIHLFRFESDEVGPIVQYEQCAVDDAFANRRHIAHQILRNIPRGACIQVGTEFYADLLQILD